MAFFKKNIEAILILFFMASLLMKNQQLRLGEGLTILAGGCLAFYYLASGILVLLDKHRVQREMRLIYFFGLWAVSMTIVGTVSKLYFYLLSADRELLILSISSIVSVLLVALLYFLKMEQKIKAAFKEQIQPLLFRGIVALIIAVSVLFVNYLRIYENFGPHRDDAKYVILLMEKVENPDNEEAEKRFEEYHQLKRAPQPDDDKTSTGND